MQTVERFILWSIAIAMLIIALSNPAGVKTLIGGLADFVNSVVRTLQNRSAEG